MTMRAIDLFAGAGGFSLGARMAGAAVVWAANHWQDAVDWHRHNHPEAIHVCQDLHQADWSAVPEHDVMLASPACQGHSKARGRDRATHDADRSTAWAVVSAAEYHRPDVVVIENVACFRRWQLYQPWCLALEALGYTLAPHILDAADHGVPQHRERMFIVGTRTRRPLWLNLPKSPHRAAADIIDFGRGSWSPVTKPGRSERTLERIRNGQRAHGDRCLVAYYGGERGGRSLSRPLGTVTTRDRYALVDGDRMRMLTAGEYRAAMGFPDSYQLPPQHRLATHLLGNAVVPAVARDVINAIREAA